MIHFGPIFSSRPLDLSDKFVSSSLLFFFFFMVAQAEYGSSQVRGPIGAVATGLCHRHSNARSELRLRPTLQLTATLNPCENKARDPTRVLMDASQVGYH